MIVPLLLLSCKDVKETDLGNNFYLEQSDDFSSAIRYKNSYIVSLVNDYKSTDSLILIKSYYLNTENSRVSDDSFVYYIIRKTEYGKQNPKNKEGNIIGPVPYRTFRYKSQILNVPAEYCDQLK